MPVQFALEDRASDRALPTAASKCAGEPRLPSDARPALNHAHGGHARAAGRFPLAENSTTNRIKGLREIATLFLWCSESPWSICGPAFCNGMKPVRAGNVLKTARGLQRRAAVQQ